LDPICSSPFSSELRTVHQSPSFPRPLSPLIFLNAGDIPLYSHQSPLQPIPIRPIRPRFIHLLDRPTHPHPHQEPSFSPD
jgi:hypothetical protein